jgi:hypothetical protein
MCDYRVGVDVFGTLHSKYRFVSRHIGRNHQGIAEKEFTKRTATVPVGGNPKAKGPFKLVSALETASSVKLVVFGIPFNGQTEVCRATGEPKERVAKKEATRMVR